MRWSRGHTGGIEDRRAQGGLGGGFGMGGLGSGGGGVSMPVGLGGGAGLIVLLAVLALNLLGGGLTGDGTGSGLDPFGAQGAVQPGQGVDLSNDDDQVEFVGAVLDDVNGLWADTFKRAGETYQPTTLVLFTSATTSGCGRASEASGPFYCPADRKVYLDLGFFKELKDRFGAPGDFAQAYVIAHEVGHHVQQLTGIEDQVQQLEAQDPSQANALSVKLELQADCLAGVWASSVYKSGDLDPGDLDEGLNAAASVGDDRIQAGAGMAVNPETWTHGSAAQRSSWLHKGFDSGDPAACDTFGS